MGVLCASTLVVLLLVRTRAGTPLHVGCLIGYKSFEAGLYVRWGLLVLAVIFVAVVSVAAIVLASVAVT